MRLDAMEMNLLDRMLDEYLTGKTPVTVTLQNKIRVSGKIKAFDSYVLIMESHKREIIYRHAISSVAPLLQEIPKQQPVVKAKPEPAAPPRPAKKTVPHRSKPPQQPSASAASSGDPGLNNSLKDGLMKWMQENKAAQ